MRDRRCGCGVGHDDRDGDQRPIPKAPGFLTSALRIFDLSVGEMLWSRRTIFMALVVGAPVLIALFLRLLDALGAPVFRVNGESRWPGRRSSG